MADKRERRAREEYDRQRGLFDDRSDFGREDDGDNGLASIRGEKSRHDRAWRFNTLTDFLE